MDEKKLIANIEYLVDKYLIGRNDLIELVMRDTGSVKYILSEIRKYKKQDYDTEDIDLIKDISFYYI